MWPRIWPCAEPRCPKQVEYKLEERESLKISARDARSSPFPVYMTCGLGHTHRYVVGPGAL